MPVRLPFSSVSARRVQQVFETLLVASIFFTLIFIIMRASLRNETVPKISTCTDLSEHSLAWGSNGFAQRLFQYYVTPRLKEGDFVFCPMSFYQLMLELGWFCQGDTLTELQKAVQLPCEVRRGDLTRMREDNGTEHFVMMTDWRKRIDPHFLWAMDVDREDVLSTRRKFHESMSSSDHLGLAVLSKNHLSFRCQHDELDFAVATKFMLSNADVDAYVVQREEGVITTRAFVKDLPNTCTRLLEIFTTLEGKVLVFIVPRPLGQCNFEKLLKDMKTRNLNEPLLYNQTTEVLVRFAPIRVRTVLGLSAALQGFNAISMFYREEAHFDRILLPHSAGLAVRAVEQETEVNLGGSAFHPAHHPGDNPETPEVEEGAEEELVDITGQEQIFLLIDNSAREAIVLGRRGGGGG